MNDSAYTLHLDYIPRKKGRFQNGNIPWNKGLSWDEQGYTEERKEKIITQLRENKKKNDYSKTADHFKHPVVQMDEYGNKLHWYASSEDAARKLGITGRNIRKVCDGERNFCGGYRWCWDKRFL